MRWTLCPPIFELQEETHAAQDEHDRTAHPFTHTGNKVSSDSASKSLVILHENENTYVPDSSNTISDNSPMMIAVGCAAVCKPSLSRHHHWHPHGMPPFHWHHHGTPPFHWPHHGTPPFHCSHQGMPLPFHLHFSTFVRIAETIPAPSSY